MKPSSTEVRSRWASRPLAPVRLAVALAWVLCAAACSGGGSEEAAPALPQADFITPALPAGYAAAQVNGLSWSGGEAAVVSTSAAGVRQAFRWSAATGAVVLGSFGGGSNRQGAALAVSRDGSTAVGVGHPFLTGAVSWAVDGSSAVLGKLPGDASARAVAVSDDGAVVTGSSVDDAGVPRAFRWTAAGGMVPLDAAPGLAGMEARSVSGDGSVIAGCGKAALGDVAFIWRAGRGTQILQDMLKAEYVISLDGWSLGCATAISGDGRTLAGVGTGPQGPGLPWIVRLPR